jgi:hypothetical protein
MSNKIKAFIYYFSQGNPKVFGLILISTFFVILARLLAPVEMNWDEAVQLEAAHRLVKGLGLTSTFFPPPYAPVQIPSNINQTPIPQALTWWPPGFSLLVAAFLFLGIPLASSLKILYSVTTLIGWFGWAIIGSHCLSKPLQLGARLFPAQLFIAAFLPVFYTPAWWGTDLFLWAGFPFVVLLLFHSTTRSKLKYVVFAGLLFGFLVNIRYSTLFVAIVAFLILFQVNFYKFKTFTKNYSIFLGSSLFFIFPLGIYNKLAGSNKPTVSLYNNATGSSTVPGLPEFVNFKGSFLNIFDAISSILHSSLTISQLSGISTQPVLIRFTKPFIESFESHLASHAAIYGAIWLLLVFSLPLLVLTRSKNFGIEEKKRDISLSLSLVPLSLLILLVASSFAQDYDFVGTPRYYIPVFLPALFIFYEFATLQMQKTYQLIKILFSILIITFLVYNLLYRPLLIIKGKQLYLGQSVLGSYLSYKPDYRYPSNKVITLYDETSSTIRQFQKENPEALFFIQDYVFYVYDGHEGFRTLPVSDFWNRAYVDKAVKIFWVVSRRSCPGICPDHISKTIDKLSSQPGLKTVYTSPHDKAKILVSDLPKGYKF